MRWIYMRNQNIECWEIFEVCLEGPTSGNPFIDVQIGAVFTCGNKSIIVDGFYDGGGIYKIRLMPDIIGTWTYETKSNRVEFHRKKGTFDCIEASSGNHGPVRVRDTFHFSYEDGTLYYPFGTTCYVWNHQGDILEEKTLETLETSPFNKIRMCVFPKDYDYNHNNPEFYPFEGSLEVGWDFDKFNPKFFEHLEKRICDLMSLNIEADLILFHPYDNGKWGFDKMNSEVDDRYLRYIVSRLAAYRNVWWSFANEYDLMKEKTLDDWERFAKIVVEKDPYNHLRSIHNCIPFYDHKKPWITHCSIQRQDIYKTSEYTNEWREIYQKPVVIDECAYEGNIQHGWGNITGQELTRRFWEGTVRGGYVGHGETFINPEEVLWWSKGGDLHGESPKRIAFLRKIVEDAPIQAIEPIKYTWDVPCGGKQEEFYLIYFGFNQPTFRNLQLPEDMEFRVDIIDTWEMTITTLDEIVKGNGEVKLPGKPYMALRLQRV